MNKIIIPIIITALVIAILATALVIIFKKNDSKKATNETAELPDNFTCTAHTGCMGTEDNSLEAIEMGAKHGADIVEFDVYFTENDEPVLSHDKPKGKEVTLDEAFKKVSEYKNLKVNVDIKSYGSLEKIVECAEKHNLKDRIFFTGIFLKDTEAVKKSCPDIDYYLNSDIEKKYKQTDEYIESLVKTVKDSGAVGINCHYKNVTEEMVNAFRENGLLVSVWTVNKESDMHKVLKIAPDNITTRHPDVLKNIIE